MLPLLSLAMLVLAQALSLAAGRGRRSWIDLGSWLLAVAALAMAAGRLASHGVLGILLGWLPLLLLAFALLGLAAAWRSFVAGGLPAQVHRAHSRVFNRDLVALAALVLAFAFAATRPAFSALSGYTLAASNADGSLWLIGGPQGRQRLAPIFLVEPASGSATYVGPLAQLLPIPRLGDRAAEVLFRQGSGYERLHLRPDETPQPLPYDPFAWAGDTLANVDASGLLELRVQDFTVAVRELPSGQERLRFKLPAEEGGSVVAVVQREKALFDLVAEVGKKGDRYFEIYRLDAANDAYRRDLEWRPTAKGWPASYSWWQQALPLADAGVPLEVLAEFAEPQALASADGAFVAVTETLSSDPFGRRFAVLNRRGACLGAFEIPRAAYLSGEIRPGLLLAGIPQGDTADAEDFRRERGASAFAGWTTLVVEVPSGRILRRLPGFAPSHPKSGTRRTFLLGPYGEPYDLESADAEPRRILPWRPGDAAWRGMR